MGYKYVRWDSCRQSCAISLYIAWSMSHDLPARVRVGNRHLLALGSAATLCACVFFPDLLSSLFLLVGGVLRSELPPILLNQGPTRSPVGYKLASQRTQVRLPDGQTYSFLSPMKVRVPCSSRNVVDGLKIDATQGGRTITIDGHTIQTDSNRARGTELPSLDRCRGSADSTARSPQNDAKGSAKPVSWAHSREGESSKSDNELNEDIFEKRRKIWEEEREKSERRREFAKRLRLRKQKLKPLPVQSRGESTGSISQQDVPPPPSSEEGHDSGDSNMVEEQNDESRVERRLHDATSDVEEASDTAQEAGWRGEEEGENEGEGEEEGEEGDLEKGLLQHGTGKGRSTAGGNDGKCGASWSPQPLPPPAVDTPGTRGQHPLYNHTHDCLPSILRP